MRLENKKALVSRTLGIGKGRISFNPGRLSEIKEAITKQDIKDLFSSNAILIKDKGGRAKVEKRKSRRRAGSIRKKVKNSKKKYVTLTRKLRAHLKNLKDKGKISREDFLQLRREIRASNFKSQSHMNERINQIKEQIK